MFFGRTAGTYLEDCQGTQLYAERSGKEFKKGITNTSQKVWYLDVLMTRTGNLETDPFFSELLRVIESEIHRQGCILMHIFHQPLFSNDRKCRTENIDKVIAQMEPDGEIRSDGLIIIGNAMTMY